MLLVVYNSNPYCIANLETQKGWSLYRPEDWAVLCMAVNNYFFYLREDAMLENKSAEYLSYREWLADYQVSEVEDKEYAYQDLQFLNTMLGADFYVPDIATQPDDDLLYPEQDAYA